MKRLVQFKVVILLLVLAVLLAACSSSSDDTSGEDDKNNNGEDLVLNLGESGVVKNQVGDFEVTVESFEIHESYDGMEIEHEDHVFVIVDFSIKNVDEEVLNGNDISRPTLVTEEGDRASNDLDVQSIERIKEDLQSGEEDSGQMFFYTYDSDNFVLSFGYEESEFSNEVAWEFSRSEAN